MALELFQHRGFDETTMDDVAAAAGVGRRTVFRYFESKNDLPWGDFEALLDDWERRLASEPRGEPVLAVITRCVVDFNRFDPAEAQVHRQRMQLLLRVPALVAHSAVRYEAWRSIVARFVASRRGVDPSALEPRAIGHMALGAALAAYERWLDDEDAELGALLEQSFSLLAPLVDEPDA